MRGWLSILIIATIVFGIPTIASAQTIWCSTKVTNLLVYGNGNAVVFPSARGAYVQFCNINSDWKGISPLTCVTWLSLLRSAVSRQADVTIEYASGATDCINLPTFGDAPAPSYVMLKN
jgi:hypothetical protein